MNPAVRYLLRLSDYLYYARVGTACCHHQAPIGPDHKRLLLHTPVEFAGGIHAIEELPRLTNLLKPCPRRPYLVLQVAREGDGKIDGHIAVLGQEGRKAADMVAMYVGYEDYIDLPRVDLELTHVVKEKRTVSAGIEQYALITDPHQARETPGSSQVVVVRVVVIDNAHIDRSGLKRGRGSRGHRCGAGRSGRHGSWGATRRGYHHSDEQKRPGKRASLDASPPTWPSLAPL